jgi:hypothetical protein
MINEKNFAAFILTHGRADNVKTYSTLRKHGYTGKIVIVIDDEDKQRDLYLKNFGEENVEVFCKKEEFLETDMYNNTERRDSIILARNVSFKIAKKRGIEYFIQLDDDYDQFSFTFDEDLEFKHSPVKDLDQMLNLMLDFYKAVPNLLSLAMAQGGDFVGGANGQHAKGVKLMRKCMNSIICSVHRPYRFVGLINEDVNTYCSLGNRGNLFFTFNFARLNQATTQSQEGGITDFYLDNGTYVKSFYTVMPCPSFVTVGMMGYKSRRLHHRIQWKNAVPKIVSEKWKK